MTRLNALAGMALLLTALPLSAAVYHVAPDGSDGAGGSSSDPWQTLQHAADSVGPGDRVIVHAGTYAGFDLRTSGTPSGWIEFVARDGVVIDAPNGVTGDGINLEAVSWVLVEGFTVQGASAGQIRNGLRAVGTAGNPASHVTFRDNRSLDNLERGILTGFVNDLVIEGNETAGSINEHGIYVSNSSDRPTIRNNRAHGNHAAGIHMNGDATLGGDGLIENALVEGNVIVDNGLGGGAGINGDGVVDSLIRNNLLVGNHASGIILFRQDGGAAPTGNRIIGNTVVNATLGRWGLTIRDGGTGSTVLNNIFLSRHSYRGAIDIHTDSLPGLVSDHNVVEDVFSTDSGDSIMTLSQWQNLTGQDAGSFVGTEAALFVNPQLPDGDYHLGAGSPALDAGSPDGVAVVDFEGDWRNDGAPDIGADERKE